MTLSPGVRLGSFEILAKLGAGGMGEVYKARDVRLDRTVAIKVLLTGLARDPDLRQRLEREARAIASLQHPHICTLYEFGHAAGTDYLVMEYLVGQTLAERLRGGALPLDTTLRYALEIADALDQAHRTGIVHRDLKPGNIMVTASGIKLLDFGLAKIRPEGAVAGFNDRPTQTSVPLTGEGTILGTLAYMAPEQIEGQAADHRSDIWALGCVVYEMAAGTKTFSARTDAGTIAAILERDPEPLSRRQPLVPRSLERVVGRCLAKDPEERWQSARDVFLELRAVLAEAATVPAARVSRWRGAAAVALGVLAAIAVAAVYWTASRGLDTPRTPILRLTIAPGPEAGSPRMPAISPDGAHVAFVAASADGGTRLWIWSMEAGRAQAVPATDDATLPFWSPDSRFIGFFAGGKLKKVGVNGGPAQVLADAPNGRGGSWSTNGVIIFAPAAAGGLFRVSGAGGPAVPLTSATGNKTAHLRPWFLPDGDHFLFLVQEPGQVTSAAYVSSLDEPSRASRVADTDSEVAYARGFLIYARGPALVAHAFDDRRLQTHGEATAIADHLPFLADRGTYSSFSVSADGIVCHASGVGGRHQFTWVDHAGRLLRKVGPAGFYRDFDLSPDGRRVVVARFEPDRGLNQLWLLDLDRGTSSRFTVDETSHTDPVWSPDGRSIAFSKRAKLFFDIYQQGIEANPRERVLLAAENTKYVEDWSRDHRFILYGTRKAATDLWVLPLFGAGQPMPLVESPFTKDEPQFSPDGRWVAYGSIETGRWDVYVTSFPDAQQKYPVSTSGGVQPQWRGDGQELFYLGLDGTMMSVQIETQRRFAAGTPKALFSTGLVPNPGSGQYAVTDDGRRFLLLTEVEAGRSPAFAVVLNWERLVRP